MNACLKKNHKQPLKVAIFSPFATLVPHFGTELDIAQQHLDAGDSVEFINCMGGLKNCDHNINHAAASCVDCVGRRKMGLGLLNANVNCHSFSATQSRQIRTDFESVDDLIAYKIDNFDIGYAALSSIVSMCRDPEPDLVKHRETLNRFLESAWQAYEQTLEFLSHNKIDRVYTFNFFLNCLGSKGLEVVRVPC